MVVVVDTVSATPLRPRTRKGEPPDALSPPIRTGFACAREFARLCDTRQIVKETASSPCARGGLPRTSASAGQEARTFMIMGTPAPALPSATSSRHAGRARCAEPDTSRSHFKLGLAHIVITRWTGTTCDGGAAHFARNIGAIRARCPPTTIEILTPDFLRKEGAARSRGGGET